MVVQDLLHLKRKDVFTPVADANLDPVNKMQLPGVVEPARITAMELQVPPRLHRTVRHVVITGHETAGP